MGRVEGKIVIVTGGAQGIGAADVKLLSDQGAKVIVADKDEVGGRAVADRYGADFHHLDVSSETEWVNLISAVRGRYRRLDALVNNAGIIRVGDPCTIELDDLRLMMSVNVEGTMLGCKHAIPLMIESGGGSIVNMASIGAVSGLYFFAGYCASKGAVAAYTRAVAVYGAQNQLNIRCNAIFPGGVNTPLNEQLAVDMAESMSAMRIPPASPVSADGPQTRYCDPEEIAHAVVYLVSDESAFMNGAELRIDNSASITAAAVA